MRGVDQEGSREGTCRVLSQGRGRCDAHRLPLGADDSMRRATLRSRSAAHPLAPAREESQPHRGPPTYSESRVPARRAEDHRQAKRRLGGPGLPENENRNSSIRRNDETRFGNVCLLRIYDAGGSGARATEITEGRSHRRKAHVCSHSEQSRARPVLSPAYPTRFGRECSCG
jgi:hypothetical protein